MSGYSKLRLVSKKSRSIDFSDLHITNTFPFDQTQKNASPTIPDHGRKNPAAREEINTIHEHEDDHEDDHREYQSDDNSATRKSSFEPSVGGMHCLSKNTSSVSVSGAANSSNRFRSLERQTSSTQTPTPTTPRGGMKSAVKRAFSMRRSSSSSVHHDKYRRIHDQCVAILLDDDEDEDGVAIDGNIDPKIETMRSKCGSKGKIFRACKRLLGFQ